MAHISGHFPQIWDLCTNIANNIHVHYRTNSVKIRQKFSISSKGPVFGLFSILVVEIFFLENQALSHTTSYGFLASCQNLEKTNDTIPRKCPDRQKGEWKDDGSPKINCLIHTILLVILCLFLVIAIAINCYFWCTKYYLGNDHIISINEDYYVTTLLKS